LPLIGEVEDLVVKTCWLELSTEVVFALWVQVEVEVVEIWVGDVPMVAAEKEALVAYWDCISIIHF
jgi:hypothetical protein